MKQKIDWYREVLELEPGSRVFFPLAKLLAADGQAAQAVLTLKQGLLRHPDHVEARLLLVELLHLQQADAEVAAEIDSLGKILASYPGFWSAWSEYLAANPLMQDASLSMRFFAAALRGKNIGWGDIISKGLNAVLSSDGASGPPDSAYGGGQGLNIESTAGESGDSNGCKTDTEPAEDVSSASVRDLAESAVAVLPHFVKTADETVLTDDEEEKDEAFSLRTRSMAEVLADQGDIAGALDIYHELVQSASPEDKAVLTARIEELRNVGSVDAAEQESDDGKNYPHASESMKIVNLMESLAERLEARAR
ncbi:MAG: tetratricopeptide repeat-containing protein [Desulfovibrio sp.]|jgi:tetratricopeptide (TPR) repeat protein|nr:tetratricopeptide repeat-containing protein [Desulfovibrio sp.]